MTHPDPVTGTAAGVPFLALPPSQRRPDSPVVVAWHLLDPPRTAAAFAAAVPLGGFDGWRIYLDLPMSGSRAPAGGMDGVIRAGMADAVRQLKVPVIEGGAAEFPQVLAELRARFGLRASPLGLLGGSDGSAVVGSVVTDVARAHNLTVDAVVLVSPVSRLRDAVDATARAFGFTYPWDDETDAVAERHDLVRRVDEFVAGGCPPVRIVVGADDDERGFVQPARDLAAALTSAYGVDHRVDLQVVAGMGHALAKEPGIRPAPQSEVSRAVDALATEWFGRFLR